MARVELPRILGVNQLADETALVNEEGSAMFVRKALNADIDSTGNVNRRYGRTSVLSGSGYHSLYSSERGWLMLCHKHELGILDPTTAFTPLVNMNDVLPTSYAEENGILYAMNSAFSCKFKPGDYTAYDLGVSLPSIHPSFSADTTAGTLPAGSYGVAYSVVNSDGEESGLGPVVQIDLASQGRIRGTLFTIMAGYIYRIYMTTTDGEELYQVAEFEASQTTYDIMEHEGGRQPQTFGLEPLPYGYIIRAYNSRLFVGTVGFVYFSEAFRPHLYNPAHNWVPSTGPTLMMEPVQGGIFIGDKRGVQFYAGEDPTRWEVKSATSEAPIYGTSTVIPGSYFRGEIANFDEVAVWLSVSGYQIGLPNGEIVRINAGQVRLPSYTSGCSTFAIHDGRKQFISPVNSNILAGAGVALDSTVS